MNDPSLSFEEALKQLEQLIRELERGQAPLDTALSHYQKGIQYVRHCHQLLEEAEGKLEVLMKDSAGNLVPKTIENLQELKETRS